MPVQFVTRTVRRLSPSLPVPDLPAVLVSACTVCPLPRLSAPCHPHTPCIRFNNTLLLPRFALLTQQHFPPYNATPLLPSACLAACPPAPSPSRSQTPPDALDQRLARPPPAVAGAFAPRLRTFPGTDCLPASHTYRLTCLLIACLWTLDGWFIEPRTGSYGITLFVSGLG